MKRGGAARARTPRVATQAAAAAAVVLALLLSAFPLVAQVEATAELQGEVRRGGVPSEGVEVVLHRVAPDGAGEFATVRTDPGGGFHFTLPQLPRDAPDGVVYFVSVVHDGITYFGTPITRAIQLDSLHRVETWDTVTAPVQGAVLPLATRYLVAAEEADGWTITDLLEIDHQGEHTVVAREGGITWRHPLPAGIRDPETGGGDLAPDVTQVVDGEVRLSGPISPGARQVILRYRVDALDGLEVPLAPETAEVEFLVREPAPDIRIEGLAAVGPVEMQPGVIFRRYAAPRAAGLSALRVGVAEPPFRLPVEWVAVTLALVFAVGGLVGWSRWGGRSGAPVPAASPGATTADPTAARNALLLEIAQLDRRLEANDLDPAETERLTARRAALAGRLAAGR